MSGHGYDPIDDRCKCGAEIIYFEDIDQPGDGCDVQGHPWGQERPVAIKPTMLDVLLESARDWIADCGDAVPTDDRDVIIHVQLVCEGGWTNFCFLDQEIPPSSVEFLTVQRYGHLFWLEATA